MKLRYSATSPYVRKVLMVAAACGIPDRIERDATDPWAADTTLGHDNPLGKVPALVLDDGTTLYDSPVICEYLDWVAGVGKVIPAPGPARWTALRRQALGDGICDAAILRRLEHTQRPAERRSDTWDARQKGHVTRALNALEAEADHLGAEPDIGTISILVALGYLDFRFGAEDWRQGRPRLTAWFAAASTHASYRDTAPPQ
jgi:glutathione S-transferase